MSGSQKELANSHLSSLAIKKEVRKEDSKDKKTSDHSIVQLLDKKNLGTLFKLPRDILLSLPSFLTLTENLTTLAWLNKQWNRFVMGIFAYNKSLWLKIAQPVEDIPEEMLLEDAPKAKELPKSKLRLWQRLLREPNEQGLNRYFAETLGLPHLTTQSFINYYEDFWNFFQSYPNVYCDLAYTPKEFETAIAALFSLGQSFQNTYQAFLQQAEGSEAEKSRALLHLDTLISSFHLPQGLKVEELTRDAYHWVARSNALEEQLIAVVVLYELDNAYRRENFQQQLAQIYRNNTRRGSYQLDVAIDEVANIVPRFWALLDSESIAKRLSRRILLACLHLISTNEPNILEELFRSEKFLALLNTLSKKKWHQLLATEVVFNKAFFAALRKANASFLKHFQCKEEDYVSFAKGYPINTIPAILANPEIVRGLSEKALCIILANMSSPFKELPSLLQSEGQETLLAQRMTASLWMQVAGKNIPMIAHFIRLPGVTAKLTGSEIHKLLSYSLLALEALLTNPQGLQKLLNADPAFLLDLQQKYSEFWPKEEYQKMIQTLETIGHKPQEQPGKQIQTPIPRIINNPSLEMLGSRVSPSKVPETGPRTGFRKILSSSQQLSGSPPFLELQTPYVSSNLIRLGSPLNRYPGVSVSLITSLFLCLIGLFFLRASVPIGGICIGLGAGLFLLRFAIRSCRRNPPKVPDCSRESPPLLAEAIKPYKDDSLKPVFSATQKRRVSRQARPRIFNLP